MTAARGPGTSALIVRASGASPRTRASSSWMAESPRNGTSPVTIS